MLTKQERIELSQKIYENLEKTMDSLYGRWSCEKEYEDIKDYGEVIKKIIEPMGATFLRMKKRPFSFEYSLPQSEDSTKIGTAYVVFINSTQYGYKKLF